MFYMMKHASVTQQNVTKVVMNDFNEGKDFVHGLNKEKLKSLTPRMEWRTVAATGVEAILVISPTSMGHDLLLTRTAQ
jgi:hypothetical protein